MPGLALTLLDAPSDLAGAALMNIRVGGGPLQDLQTLGQSMWLEGIHRGMLRSSEFAKLIAEDGISGVTSNLMIFAKAFADDPAYGEPVTKLRAAGATGRQIYQRLSIEDIRGAADQLRRIYNNTGRRDGYASIEVSPALAYDTDGTVAEGRGLFNEIDRPNIMINVPATAEGVCAIRRLIAAGINVNATLIFGTRRYREVAEAYLSGLEDRAVENRALADVASVASVFVSGIDTLVDSALGASQHSGEAERAQRLRGKAGIAVAGFAYQEYKGLIASPRWQALAAGHARSQRLLWASTSIKNPAYSDLKYIDGLIGRDTVSTVSLSTLRAFLDHGVPRPTLASDLLDVAALPGELQEAGIDLDQVSRQLEREGIEAFTASMNVLEARLVSGSTV
jgi:transaldolase